MSVDPSLAETLEPYSYGADNPVTNIDPDGCHCISDAGIYYKETMVNRSWIFPAGMEYTDGPAPYNRTGPPQ